MSSCIRRRLSLGSASWLALAAAGAPLRLAATEGQTRRIGWMGTGLRAANQPSVDAFAAQLESRGHKLGRDIEISSRFAEGDLERLPALARELVALQPAVIVGVGSPCSVALGRETRSVPIVMHTASNPVDLGLVASLARPGGNVTGTTASQPEIAGKLLEVLKVANPAIASVAVFRNPDNLGIKQYTPHALRTADRLGIRLHYFELRRIEDLRFEDVDRVKPDALYIINDFLVSQLNGVLLRYALQHKLVTIGAARPFAVVGGLLSLGLDLAELDAIVVDYVDRILRGASPALLPVRQPTRFQLVINRRTAQAIGLPLSEELLIRAHEIIDG